jgi:branched-chain amino acid transport system substrate-binding protein
LDKYVWESGFQRVAIYYSGDEYGRGLANAFEEQASIFGLKVVDRVSDFKDSADVQRMVDKWELLDVQVVLVATNANEGIRFIRELRSVGFGQPVIGGDALDNDHFASSGKFVEGTVVVSIYHPDMDADLNKQFQQQFKDKYGIEPSKWAAQAYDSLRLLADTIEKAQSRSPKEMAMQLASGQPWEGVVGSRSFDANGNVEGMELIVKQVRGGTFEIIEH